MCRMGSICTGRWGWKSNVGGSYRRDVTCNLPQGGRKLAKTCRLWPASGPVPLLARRVGAGLQLERGAIPGAAITDAQAQARLDSDDCVLDAEGPLLVRPAVALKQVDRGPVRRALAL